MIKLVDNYCNKNEIDELVKWLSKYPKVTQGDLVKRFEKKFAEWQDCRYAVFVNSGSSANLLISYVLTQTDAIKNKKIILPALSWATTVSPWIQFGYTPYLCDVDKDTLGLDLNHLESLFKKHNPDFLMLVHVLGIPNKMDEIVSLCEKYNVTLLEDNCESQGSRYKGLKTGNYGLMSSFSFFFGHLSSTIEGGMICTNNKGYYNFLKILREHGWDRTASKTLGNQLQKDYEIDDFNRKYTFYLPGFNVRSTELNAHIGLNQLKKYDSFIEKRNKNFNLYQELIDNEHWKINPVEDSLVANFAYPLITPHRKQIADELEKNQIETRPLIAGNIGLHPFWFNIYGKCDLPFANEIHSNGMYLPNHPGLSEDEIKFICQIVNSKIKEFKNND